MLCISAFGTESGIIKTMGDCFGFAAATADYRVKVRISFRTLPFMDVRITATDRAEFLAIGGMCFRFGFLARKANQIMVIIPAILDFPVMHMFCRRCRFCSNCDNLQANND